MPNASAKIADFTTDSFRMLVESVQDYAIFMLDVDGHVLTWNRGAQRIKGYAADEIIGREFSAFYPIEDIKARKPQKALQTAALHGHVEDEGWRLRKDGTRFWANVVITALYDDGGTLRGFGKVTRDLTERRVVEEDLRHSEERFRLLLEGIQEYAVYMLDVHGNVSTWNAGAERIKGYTSQEIVGQHYSTFFTAEDRAAERPDKELAVARDTGRFEEEGWRVRKDGTRFWANVVLTPLRKPGGELVGYAKITRDLTERKAAEETARELMREQAARVVAEQAEIRVRHERERYKAAAKAAAAAAVAAEQASRVKDEFLATVSHELRTPLNAIVGWSALLRDRVSDGTALKGLEIIHRNAQAQAKIIDDILDVSRIITGKLRLDLKPVDLCGVVNDAIEVVRPSAVAKRIRIDFVPPLEPCLLVADPERLQQVVWNLLSNAVKFTPSEGTIAVLITRDESRLALRVTDTGQGIDADFLPYVFDRFKQADSSTTRRVGGLGLGLAIVRHLVELHGGQVYADSAGVGKGSTFSITLPVRAVTPREVAPSAEAGEDLEPQAQTLIEGSLQGLRVLVVDDEPDARELLHALLLRADARVQIAGSAAEALEMVQSFRPEVLVSDIGMPDEDGYALMRRLRSLDPALGGGIPSIALTAYARGEDKTKALAAGFTTHMGKPVQAEDLLAAIVNLAKFAPKRGEPKAE